jgi:hypothetical protein
VLPWHHYALHVPANDLGIDLPSFAYDRTGVQMPRPYFGIAAVVVAAALVAAVVVRRLGGPVPPMSQVHLVGSSITLGLVLAKLLSDTEYLGIGAQAGVVFATAFAVGGFLLSQEGAVRPDRPRPPG